MKKKYINWISKNVSIILVYFALGVFFGIFLGMVIQQSLITKSLIEVAEGLEETNFNIEINFNETKFIEGFNQSMHEVIEKEKKIE